MSTPDWAWEYDRGGVRLRAHTADREVSITTGAPNMVMGWDEFIEFAELLKGTDRSHAEKQLAEAERELMEWATGQRSFWNQQRKAQMDDLGSALVQTAQRDAAELEIQINKVRALRLLVSGEGLGPWT